LVHPIYTTAQQKKTYVRLKTTEKLMIDNFRTTNNQLTSSSMFHALA